MRNEVQRAKRKAQSVLFCDLPHFALCTLRFELHSAMFANLNRQLSKTLVEVFRHPVPLYYCDGGDWIPFDAIREPFDTETDTEVPEMPVSFQHVGFQVTGDVWTALDKATRASGKRFIFEVQSSKSKVQSGDTLNCYEIDKNEPFTEITADRHAIRINTVFIGEKPARQAAD
jgi:hypothetical protein